MAQFLATRSGPGDATTPRGVVLAIKGLYTVPATSIPGAADTVVMGTLPPDAVILGMTLYADGGTGSLTITLGDADDADRYGTVSDATDAFEHVATGMGGRQTIATTQNILMTLGGASLTAGDKYRLTAWYFIESLEPAYSSPSSSPSTSPSSSPSATPSTSPSEGTPSGTPSGSPSGSPSTSPSASPSATPSGSPSAS